MVGETSYHRQDPALGNRWNQPRRTLAIPISLFRPNECCSLIACQETSLLAEFESSQ